MIKPTIGRVVWYHPHPPTVADPAGMMPPEQYQPYAAIIAYVHSDTLVNLAIFDFNGRMSEPNQTSVYLYQGDTDRPNAPYCEWMPYQQGQAAKTEALEKQLSEKK